MKIKIKILKKILLLICLVNWNSAYSQTEDCTFDGSLQFQLEEVPNFQFLMQQAEQTLQQAIANDPLAILNGADYTVPVVFHIIHTGEPVGIGSNISEAQILQSLNDLNDDFRDVQNNGHDVGIDFCLAQRDPDGNSQFNGNGDNITGIQRVDGTVVNGYNLLGMSMNGNEVELKALSNWPNTDYFNIWIVHDIAGSAVGFATFPVADDDRDGIVMQANVTGTGLSKVISHEAGHYLDLYHTFQGSSSHTQCPINNDCNLDGDMVCDTRPHPYMNEMNNWFPCDESQYTACDPSFSLPDQVTENYMNYTSNACSDEFTEGQVMRLRGALMNLRPSLMSSLGCQPSCPSVDVDFMATSTETQEGGDITFTNNSSGATSYVWEVGTEQFTSTNLTYQFEERGLYDVCLTAEDPSCSNRRCISIHVLGEDPCTSLPSACDLLVNGDFEQTNFQYQEGYYFNAFQGTLDRICNWNPKFETPDIIHNDGVPYARLVGFTGHEEGLVTATPLALQAGVEYLIKIQYAAISEQLEPEECNFIVGFAETGETYRDHAIDEVLGNFTANKVLDISNEDLTNTNFTLENSDLNTTLVCYTPEFNEDKHLYITIENAGDGFLTNCHMLIKEIEVVCKGSCQPIPDFTFDPNCPSTFTGSNAGDGNDYEWTFLCDGYSTTGQEVTRDFPKGSTCEVCLTISCDMENATTICKVITNPSPSDCPSSCINMNVLALACDETLGEDNKYIANFDIEVPSGTGPCGDAPLQANSTELDLDLVSFDIQDHPTNPALDVVSVGMSICANSEQYLSIFSEPAGLTMCDADGNIICYNLKILAVECESCGESIVVDAACVDVDPSDGIYEYDGSVVIPNLPGNQNSQYTLCEGASAEVGFSATVSGSGTSVTVDFEVATANGGAGSFPVILCLTDPEQGQTCISMTVNIPDGCPEPPEECVEGWVPKPLKSQCVIEDGQIKYSFVMQDLGLLTSGLQACDGEIWSNIEDGTAVVNSASISNNSISFDIDIFMPCDFDQSQIVHELKIFVCNSAGDMVCLLFPLKLPDCDLPCINTGEGDGDGNRKKLLDVISIKQGLNAIEIFPNPASNLLNIKYAKHNGEIHTVDVIDPMGRVLISDVQIELDITKLDIGELKSGIHFVRVKNSQGELVSMKKIIVIQ